MWREEGKAQGEVGAGEDGESLDEDVGDGLVTGEVWVELVAGLSWLADVTMILEVQWQCQEKAVR